MLFDDPISTAAKGDRLISADAINAAVWRACDTFRGVIDPAQYKDYILTFLFLKYLSDLWKDRENFYLDKYDETPDNCPRTQRALEQFERFRLPEECRYDYLYEQRNATNIGELVDMALDHLEEANRLKLDGVFGDISFNSEKQLGSTRDRNRRIKNLIEDFKSIDLTPSHLESQDVIGDVYEFLIDRFASNAGKKAGEFYTPSSVSLLLARLMNPRPGSRISDPTCGSGSLLIKVGQQVGSRNFALYGQEINRSTFALARMNMFLHGFDDAVIRWGDTLNNPLLLENDRLMKFDIVVANPPFSLDKWGADIAATDRFARFHRGVPPKSKGDFAFISHMIETTYEGSGRVGVIVPHGVLFRGSSEGLIRRKLIEENLLEAVIGLPANLFFGTGIPTAILLFNRARTDATNTDVLFVDASQSYDDGRNQSMLKKKHLDQIVELVASFRNEPQGTTGVVVDKFAYRATRDEIRENDYNLNIPRYVDTFEEEEPIDIAATQQQIARLEGELAEAKKRMSQYLSELGF
ncbi:type I restriction-modification system subunit M [Telluribacter humicola]|uniref:type I restriction-modification system subunit M n=1 Tax=Telluribacter humicola TaxID=1720261 RepID=UPI001A962C45|nr:type I restriction-modification system subunit M [Telluribacter humicola]